MRCVACIFTLNLSPPEWKPRLTAKRLTKWGHYMDEFQAFMKDFYELTDVDLSLYKRPQMERRLTSLRNKHGFHDFRSYIQAVAQEAELLDELMDKMTINVSEFMRNPERWDALIPFLKEKSVCSIKAWSAACSTGEEPHTLAMMLEEYIHRPYQILATDIDNHALQQAQDGRYKEHQIKSVSNHLLHKYFQRSDGAWKVSSDLQKNVTFAQHNLLADTYPAEFDLIICRNVMIYFTDEAKQHVIRSFSQALKPGGLLFVGSTEQFLRTDACGLRTIAPFLYEKKG
jgi:chemotaxis protein methyltransferase CheR